MRYLALLAFFPAASVFAETITFTAPEIVCASCAQAIKDAFKKSPDVESVKVIVGEKRVEVKTKDGSTLSDRELNEALERYKYTAKDISRVG